MASEPILAQAYDVQRYVLEQVKLGCVQWFDGHALANMSIQQITDELTDSFSYQLKTFVLGEKVNEERRTVDFKYPMSWWQHLKWERAPDWFNRKYPIRWKYEHREVVFKQIECFPKIKQVLKVSEREVSFTVLQSEESYAVSAFDLEFSPKEK